MMKRITWKCGRKRKPALEVINYIYSYDCHPPENVPYKFNEGKYGLHIKSLFRTRKMLGEIIPFLLFAQINSLTIKNKETASGNNIKSNSKMSWTYYIDDTNERLVAFLKKSNNSYITDCHISGDRLLTKNLLRETPETAINKIGKETLKNLIEICTYGKAIGMFHPDMEEDDIIYPEKYNGLFIYPGTKWCGAGNISESYEDLGTEVETDKCCRTHDHCPDNIPSFETKYDLKNNSPVTKSHCDCDEEFHSCLRKADTRTSHRVGKMFFNVLQMECFRKHHPIIGCKRYVGWVRRRCQEYDFDTEKEQIHQFFDAMYYEPSTSEDDDDEETYLQLKILPITLKP